MSEKINTWRGLKYYNFSLVLLSDLFKLKLLFKSILKSERLNQCNFLDIDLFYTMSLVEQMKELKDSFDKIFQRPGIFSVFEEQDKLETEEILLNHLEGKPEILRLVREVLSENNKAGRGLGRADKGSLRKEIEMMKLQNQRIREEKNKVDDELRLAKQQLVEKVELL